MSHAPSNLPDESLVAGLSQFLLTVDIPSLTVDQDFAAYDTLGGSICENIKK
jgi:hypothetical protein